MNKLFVVGLLCAFVLSPIKAVAEEVIISWQTSNQNITEIRIYGNTSDNLLTTITPTQSPVTVDLPITGCMNIWARTVIDGVESPFNSTIEIICQDPDQDPPPTETPPPLDEFNIDKVSDVTTPGDWDNVDYSFSWSANPEPVDGYKLYYKKGGSAGPPFDGVDADNGSSPIFTDKVTAYTVDGLDDNTTYHFALTAFVGQEESDYTDVITVFPKG